MNQELNHYSVSTIDNDNSRALVHTIAEAAKDRKAADLVALKISEVSYLTDYFVIVTGFSKAQVRAICDSIEAKMEEKHQQLPLRNEGKSEANWILLDYGQIIVHIMSPQERDYYNLEAFWGHAERINL